MKRFVANRAVDATIKSILIFASVHVTILVVYAVLTENIYVLNLFYILQLDVFFPEIVEGTGWFVSGIFVGVLVYTGVYRYLSKKADQLYPWKK